MKKNSWKILSDVSVFLKSLGSAKRALIFLSGEEAPTKKQLLKQFSSDSTRGIVEKELGQEGFKVRLTEGDLVRGIMGIEVEIENEWYAVDNFDGSTLYRIITENKLDGNVFEKELEFAGCGFDRDGNYLVTVISPDEPEYSNYLDEMIRKMSCAKGSGVKKTRSWKIGHRYDTEKETFVYLADVYLCQTNPGEYNNEFSDVAIEGSLLLTGNISKYKGVKEAILNEWHSLKFYPKTKSFPLAIDNKEVYKNDFSSMQQIKEEFDPTSEVISGKFEVHKLLNFLMFRDGPSHTEPTPEKLKNAIYDKIDGDMKDYVLKWWMVNSYFSRRQATSSDLSMEENTDRMMLIYFQDRDVMSTVDANIYHKALKNIVGVDTVKILEENVEKYGTLEQISMDIDTYLECSSKFFKYRRAPKNTCNVEINLLGCKEAHITEEIWDREVNNSSFSDYSSSHTGLSNLAKTVVREALLSSSSSGFSSPNGLVRRFEVSSERHGELQVTFYVHDIEEELRQDFNMAQTVLDNTFYSATVKLKKSVKSIK